MRCARGLVGRGRTLAESGRAQASSGGRHAASAHPQAPSFRTQALVRSSPQVVKTSASVVRSSARVMRRGPSVVRSPPLVVGSSASAKLSTAPDERRSPKCLISFGRENKMKKSEGGDRQNAISRPLRNEGRDRRRWSSLESALAFRSRESIPLAAAPARRVAGREGQEMFHGSRAIQCPSKISTALRQKNVFFATLVPVLALRRFVARFRASPVMVPVWSPPAPHRAPSYPRAAA